MLDTLLIQIEPRGDDATGFVAISDDGVAEWQKASCPASTFTLYRRPVPHGTKAILAHTRWATQGLPAFIENNHPIRRGPFFIIHNGHVRNDDVLFENANRKRFGRVDSEAIAARLSSFGDLADLGMVIEEIEGDAAVAAVDERDATRLVVARGNYSPLYVYNGRRIVLFASTKEAIEKAYSRHIGRISESRLELVEQGAQLEWRDGKLSRTSFTPKASPVKTVVWGGGWSNTGGWSSSTPARSEEEGTSLYTYDYECDACHSSMRYPEIETRYDAEEKMTYMFCEDCADLWDWDAFSGEKPFSFLQPLDGDEDKAVEEAITVDAADEDVIEIDFTQEPVDDYVQANRSILRSIAERYL